MHCNYLLTNEYDAACVAISQSHTNHVITVCTVSCFSLFSLLALFNWVRNNRKRIRYTFKSDGSSSWKHMEFFSHSTRYRCSASCGQVSNAVKVPARLSSTGVFALNIKDTGSIIRFTEVCSEIIIIFFPKLSIDVLSICSSKETHGI